MNSLSINGNVLDLMKSYNAERRLKKAILVVIAGGRFRGKRTLGTKNATSEPSIAEELLIDLKSDKPVERGATRSKRPSLKEQLVVKPATKKELSKNSLQK